MAQTFHIDASRLSRALLLSANEMDSALVRAARKIRDEWTHDATNEAPIDTGNLRDQINGRADHTGVMLRDNAVNGGFNYSYYIHEIKGDNYIDRTLDEAKAKQILEDEIRRMFEGNGF